jgi:hypothetical protein
VKSSFRLARLFPLMLVVLCASGLSLLLLSAALAEEPRHEDPFAWTTDYSLIVTNARSYEQASDIVDFISAHGGQVGVVVSHRFRGKCGLKRSTSRCPSDLIPILLESGIGSDAMKSIALLRSLGK